MNVRILGELSTVWVGGADRQGGGDGPVVMMLHGYGAPGTDLVPLSRQLQVPQETRFIFPAAPIELTEFPGDARAWWPIDMIELQRALAAGRERDMSSSTPEGLAPARAMVEAALAELGDTPVLLGGFSQGAMLALDVALHTKHPISALALLSGTLLCEKEWTELASGRTPLRVLQSHGRHDPLLPFSQAERLRELLTTAGHEVTFTPFNGGHEIPFGVLEAFAALVRSVSE